MLMDTAQEGQHDQMHWGCCWMPVFGKVLWIAAFLSLVGGLLALWRGGEFVGIAVQTWYWNALVGGVLAIGAKVSKFHYRWQQKNG